MAIGGRRPVFEFERRAGSPRIPARPSNSDSEIGKGLRVRAALGRRIRSPKSSGEPWVAPRQAAPCMIASMAYDDDDGWPPDRVPPGDTRVISAIHGAQHAVSRRLGVSMREHGLGVSEGLVLTTVRRDEGCAPWAIRHRIGLHRSTLASILDRLEDESRIESRTTSGGRRYDIRLTAAGAIAADLADYVIESVEEEIAGYTSRSERHAAVAVFEACMAIGRRERGVSD
jgi:DNA-binding MarR family transcriptional regulator